MGGVGDAEGAGHRERQALGLIRCEQCGCFSIEAERGWEALHEIDGDGRLVLVVRCRSCSEAARNPEA